VAGHHLVARDAVGDRVHDGPLRRRDAASGARFPRRQLDHLGAAEVGLSATPSSTKTRLQTISPGLLTPFSVPPPSRKYMGGWRSLTVPA
jgi:hypothetical protein